MGAKPFDIAKHEVVRAYKRVRANDGTAGADGVSLAEFGRDLRSNLYRIWNQMSSGSYFAPPVKRVEVDKGDGKMRPLGIPTVADRVAQMVVKNRLEPRLEPLFHEDSFGYRPNRSAHDAVKKARGRCWQHDWVLDLDIRGFFDNLNWGLLMKVVRKHAQQPWMVLYIQRWLQAEVVMPDGTIQQPDKGTPQGGVISPLLANLFLHYAFDDWMRRHHPKVPFERYADDIICHCDSQAQALELHEQLKARMQACGLQLHPEKTKVVYCADSNRQQKAPVTRFTFLGFGFEPRSANGKRGMFTSFSPAVSDKALQAIGQEVRGWKLGRRGYQSLDEIKQAIGPKLQGWVNYYGVLRPSTLYRGLKFIDEHIVKWAQRKYKRLARRRHRAWDWLRRLQSRMPALFPHWWMAI
jgi:RNA-directed DNA polymerase